MPYNPFYAGGWQSGEAGDTPITPEALNHFDEGIAQAHINAEDNLLDNSYFIDPINQRGAVSFTKSGYTIDRWRSASTALEVAVEESCVRLYNSSENGNGFSQPLAPERELAEGTIVTMACMFRREGGTTELVCGSCEVPASGYNLAAKDEWDGTQLRFHAKSVYGYQLFSILVPAGVETRVVWAALYVGEYTADTIIYRRKNRIMELLECQKYYLRYADSGFGGAGYVYSSTTAYVVMTTPVAMRIAPTMTGDVSFTVRANDAKVECSIGSSVYKNGNQLRFSVDVTDKGLTADSLMFAVRASGKLEFSAEL